MNLVQLAEQAKNLSNQQLQQMLQQPDGQMPPFILAAEAARRQDIEQSAQAQPSQPSTVLDDLIQSRAAKAGVNALPGQMSSGMPQQPVPQMPPQPQQARDGGIMGLRRFANGQYIGTYDGAGAGGLDYESTPDTEASEKSVIDGIGQGIESIKQSVDPNYYNMVEPAPPKVSSLTLSGDFNNEEGREERARKIASEKKARLKNAQTSQTQDQQGEQPTQSTPPTTENGADMAKLRDQLAGIYGEEEANRMLGFSGSGWAGMAQALLDTTPGRTSGQRWANMAAAMSADREGYEKEQDARKREGAMALFNWDAEEAKYQRGQQEEEKQYQRQKSDEDKRYADATQKATREATVQGIDSYIDLTKQKISAVDRAIKEIMDSYGDPIPGVKPEYSAEHKQKLAELDQTRQALMGNLDYYAEQKNKVLGSNVVVPGVAGEAPAGPPP